MTRIGSGIGGRFEAGPEIGGVSGGEVDEKISTHTADPDAHHGSPTADYVRTTGDTMTGSLIIGSICFSDKAVISLDEYGYLNISAPTVQNPNLFIELMDEAEGPQITIRNISSGAKWEMTDRHAVYGNIEVEGDLIPQTCEVNDIGRTNATWRDLHLFGSVIVGGNVDGVKVSAHKARHENGGADEINIAGLSGSPSALASYLPLGGGTLTGKLTLDGAPTADLHSATKKYVDDEVAGGAGGAFSLVYGTTVAQDIGTITITGLDLEADKQYLIEWMHRAPGAGDVLFIDFNQDVSANYYIQWMRANDTAIDADRETRRSLGWGAGTKAQCYYRGSIMQAHPLDGNSYGSLVVWGGVFYAGDDLAAQWVLHGRRWGKNPPENLTRLDFFTSNNNGLGKGSKLFIFKKA